MANEIETEAVLTPADLRSILKVCSPDGVMVGGQSLAFWADHFGVRRPEDLVPAVSADAAERGEKKALKLVERIATIADGDGAVRVFLRYGIDPLLAVPIEEFRTTTALHSQRWPQISATLAKRRDKFRRLQSHAN